jgi:hypothetical protein
MEESLVKVQVRLDKPRQGNTSLCIDFVTTLSVEMLLDRGNPRAPNADIDARLLIVEPNPAYYHVHGVLLRARAYLPISGAAGQAGQALRSARHLNVRFVLPFAALVN